ncbi:MAG: A/G-specific adenine glycosylase [Burkholderiaceae bacterium]|nr:A/G-specific adenine glycosylase [Burkholderiaceae bacterium]
MSEFAQRLIKWQKQYGRHHLPWQQTRDPYCRWVAEIMLQQTQVSTVIDYYLKFIGKFPSISTLAQASVDEVLSSWAGLGYYSRARNLHQCAKQIFEERKGSFPLTVQELIALPGIGKSTAGAIVSACTDHPEVILDGNAKRVLCRFLKVDTDMKGAQLQRFLWKESEKLLPSMDGATYSQAIMDLGSKICLKQDPLCTQCPVRNICEAQLCGEVDRYFPKKSTKAKPKKSTYLLILLKGKKVFLQKRPENGIWGGLWSLPESNIKPDGYDEIKEIKHKFSHFEFTMYPLIQQDGPDRAEDLSGKYFSREEIFSLGLPTPIKKLLLSLSQLC